MCLIMNASVLDRIVHAGTASPVVQNPTTMPTVNSACQMMSTSKAARQIRATGDRAALGVGERHKDARPSDADPRRGHELHAPAGADGEAYLGVALGSVAGEA